MVPSSLVGGRRSGGVPSSAVGSLAVDARPSKDLSASFIDGCCDDDDGDATTAGCVVSDVDMVMVLSSFFSMLGGDDTGEAALPPSS